MLLAQLLDFFGHGLGQVVELGRVVGKIVEFPRSSTFGYKLPIADTHSFALIVGPEESVMFWEESRLPVIMGRNDLLLGAMAVV